MTATDPLLEPTALIVIRAFRPAIHTLEEKRFTSQREKTAYVGLLRKITMDAHAARGLAETALAGVTIAPHSPVVVLARSVLESAGQFAHWFLNPIQGEQRSFELLAAELAGEMGRLDHVPQTKGFENQILTVQAYVTSLTQEAEQHPYWTTLSEKQQKQVKRGKWKAIDKSTFPETLGYGPKTSADLYAWLSDASHGGMRLLKQLVQENPDVQRYMRASLNHIANSVALLLHRLADQEAQVQAFLTEHPEVSYAVNLHYDIVQS